MALIRFSVVKDKLYVPDKKGNLDTAPYSKGLSGYLGTVTKDLKEISNLDLALDEYLNTLDIKAGTPITLMVHGFAYDSRHVVTVDPSETDNAHGRHFHFFDMPIEVQQKEHTTSWPLSLGYADDRGETGLAIALAWHSKPGFMSSLIKGGKTHYSMAYDYAEMCSWSVATIIQALAKKVDNPINIFSHSLGSRVAVRTLANSSVKPFISKISNVIILGGAEYVLEAQLMYQRLQNLNLDRNTGPWVWNIGARENDVLDLLAENFGPRSFGNTQVIGHNGIGGKADRWLDLCLDSEKLRSWIYRNFKIKVAGDQPGHVWDHWYYFTYPDNTELYKKIIRDPTFTLNFLYSIGVPYGFKTNWLGD